MAGMLANFLMANSKGLYPRVGASRTAAKRRKVTRPRKAKASRRVVRGKPARLVKGSRAAKAYMAKIRRKRR